jgi:uroporphyrinogen decarboxylase
MNSRERVLATLNHEQPDRVPMDMMGNATMLLDKTYFRLRDHLGLSPIDPVRSGSSANFYDERILERFDIDFRRIFLRSNPKCNNTIHPDCSFTDPWGIRYKQEGLFVNVLESPLHGMTTVEQIDSYNWPRADGLYSTVNLAEQAKHLFEETEYALVARNPLTTGFLDRANQLMEMSEFLMTMAAAPDVAHCIIGHLLRIYMDIYTMFLDAVGPYVQMVETADDLGTQNSLLISPQMYREFIKPAEKQLYDLIHEKAPDAALFRHTDGAVFELIPDLIEVGINVLNPIQTSTNGMDQDRLKRAYGSEIIFHGALEKMEHSKEACVAEVKDRIDALGLGGGYILASCNHMIDVPPENIIAIFDTAREYGRYN